MGKKKVRKKTDLPRVTYSDTKATNYLLKNRFLLPGLIICVTFIVLFPTINNGFISNWDDNPYVINNPYLTEKADNPVLKVFTSFYYGNYHPLTMLSFIVDHSLWGFNPRFYHLVNLLLHILNVLLVYRLFKLLTSRVEIAAIVALLFGIHPMHVESVAWISERKDVLYAFFYLASLIAYLMHIRSKTGNAYLILSFVAFLLSVLSKSMAVTLPVILFAADYLEKRKLSLRTIIEKIPFLLLALVFGLLAIMSQSESGATQDFSNLFSNAQRVLLVFYSIAFYIVRVFFPLNLSVLYQYPVEMSQASFSAVHYLSPLLLIAIGVGIWRSGKYRKMLLIGFMFFLLSVLPVLQIIPVGQALTADRYTYIPYLGFFWIIADFYCRVIDKEIKWAYRIRAFVWTMFVFFILFFAIMSWNRTKVWKDGITLFSDAIEKNSTSHYCYYVRAVGYMQKEVPELNKALKDYTKCIELFPAYRDAYNGRGTLLYKLRRCNEALEDFNVYLQMKEDDAEGYANRGTAKFCLGDIKGTLEDCSKALAIDPSNTNALINRGNAKGMMNNYQEAIEDFNKALQLDKQLDKGYLNRGMSYYALGRFNEACSDWQKAAQLGSSEAQMLVSQHCR